MLVEQLHKYDHIEVEFLSEVPLNKWTMTITGQYRGRVVSEYNWGFDHEGKAIWVTSDKGLEHFIPISDILTIRLIHAEANTNNGIL